MASKENNARYRAAVKADPARLEKQRAYNRAYMASRRDLRETPEQSLLRRYKLSWDSMYEMWLSQGESCAICGDSNPARWCVDHDHNCCPGNYSCGKCVRGLLCDPCNKGMGLFQDDTDTLQSAADYLRGVKVG